MLEPTEEAESTGTFEVQVTAAEHSQPAERAAESRVEVLEESWSEHGAGPAETPWSGDDEERQQEYADASGQSLQDHLLWQLELARLAPRELAVARAIVGAASDDGYPTEPLPETARTLRPARESPAQRGQRRPLRAPAPGPPNTWCLMCSCAAPSTAGASRSTPRRCRACASTRVTPASSGATRATPPCAHSCRRRAGS